MAEFRSFKDIKVQETGEGVEASLKALLVKVTGWKPENIQHKAMSGGYVNHMWTCSDGKSRVIVRVFPEVSINRFRDFEREIRILRLLEQHGFFPPVLAQFQNGVVYGFAEGRVLTEEDMKEDHIVRLVLKTLREIHKIPWPSSGWPNDCERYQVLTSVDTIPETLNTHVHRDWCEKNLPSKETLQKHVKDCLPIFQHFTDTYPIVLSHNDLWYGNIVYDERQEKVTFVDWEAGSSGVVPMDFAVLLDNIMGESTDDEYKKKWIREYLAGPVTDQELDRWHTDTLKACVVTQLSYVVFVIFTLEANPTVQEPNLPGMKQFGIDAYGKYQACVKLLESRK